MKSSFSKVCEKITRPATFLRVVKFDGFGEITKEVDEFSKGERHLLNTSSEPHPGGTLEVVEAIKR